MLKVLITQSCLTLCNLMDCSSPGSSVHGILEARILEWIAFPSQGDLPNSEIWVSFIASRFFFFFFCDLWEDPEETLLFYNITLQYCSSFCQTLTWISHGFTCVPHPDPLSHLPVYPVPLGLPSAPALSTCLMHPTWAGDLFHTW